MKEAVANGKLVVAGPDAPDTAVCPDCGTGVQKRRFRRMDGVASRTSTGASGERARTARGDTGQRDSP
jgi:hypothetical protein